MRRDRSQNWGLNDNRTIPALFVRQRDGLLLWYSYTWSDGYYIVISSELSRREFVAWDLVLILIPISIVVIPLSAILFMTFVSGVEKLDSVIMDTGYTAQYSSHCRLPEDAHFSLRPSAKPKDGQT